MNKDFVFKMGSEIIKFEMVEKNLQLIEILLPKDHYKFNDFNLSDHYKFSKLV